MRNYDPLLHAACVVEEVDIAVDLNHRIFNVRGSVLIIVGTVPASLILVPVFPNVSLNLTIYKSEIKFNINAVAILVNNGHIALSGNQSLGNKVVPFVIDHEPAGADFTEQEVTICFGNIVIYDTGVVAVCSITFNALEFTVNQRVGVTGSGNGSTPINNGITTCAEGTAGITVSSTGNILVIHGYRSMDVTAVPIIVVSGACSSCNHICVLCPSFGITEYALTGEGRSRVIGIGQQTVLNIGNDGNSPELLHVAELLSSICLFTGQGTVGIHVTGLQLPYTNGNRSQNCLALGYNSTGTSDHDGCHILIGIHSVGSLEACCQLHMIQLPGAQAIQVDSNSHALGGIDIGSNKVKIVERTMENAIQSGIMRHQLHGCCIRTGVNSDLANNGGIVAHIIANRELHGVLAISQLHINDCDLTISKGKVNRNTVDVCLGRRSVQTGHIGLNNVCYRSGERQYVGLGGLTVQLGSIIGELICINNAGELRSISVVHCLRVVNGDVIHIESEITDDIAVIGSIITISRAVSVGDIELHNGTGSKLNSSILRCVNGEVVPTGLLEAGYHTGTAGGIIHILTGNSCPRIGGSICIQGTAGDSPTSPETHSLLRNVDPHTNASSVFEDHFLGRTKQRGLHVTGLGRIGVIDPCLHSISTAMYLTVFSSNDIFATLRPYIVILCSFRLAKLQAAGSAILEVEDNLRALTQLDLCNSRNLCIVNQSSLDGRGRSSYTLGGSSKRKAIQATDRRLGDLKDNVIGLQNHFIQANGSGHTELNALIIRNRHRGAVEHKLIGNDNVDRGFAHNLAIYCHLNNSSTGLCTCSKHAVYHSTHGSILHLPSGILGNQSSGTCRANAGSGYLYLRTGSHVYILSLQRSTIERIGGSSQRSDDQTGRNRTLRTIRRTVHDGYVVRTFLTSSKGSRSTAIQVDCGYTALLQHDLCQLVHGTTARERLLTTIQRHKNYLTICGYTNAGTGVTIRIVGTGCICSHILTIPYQHLRTGSGLVNVTLILTGVLGIIDDGSAILQNSKELCIRGGFANLNTIQIRNTGGLTGSHIIEGSVDACNDLVILANELLVRRIRVQLICISNLSRQLLHTELLVNILILVGGLYNNIITSNVGGCHIIYHLLAVLGIRIVNTLRYTGSNGRGRGRKTIVSLGHKFVVCGHGSHRQQAQQHDRSQNKRQNSNKFLVFHVFSPFRSFWGRDLCKPA